MSIAPRDILQLAVTKSGNCSTEAEIRCVVGRAYYAAYHHANAFHLSLPSFGIIPDYPCGMHETLIQQLLKPTIKRAEPAFNNSLSIGYILKGLKHLRNKADYHLDQSVIPNDAQSAIHEAEKILNK